MWDIAAFIIIPAAFLFLRCIFYHVPKLVIMIVHGLNCEKVCCNVPEMPSGVNVTMDQIAASSEEREIRSWMDNPSAFWLDPSRWTRHTWPDAPQLSDLRYDNTPADLALAYVLCDDDHRHLLGEHRVKVQISSKQRWDRQQGVNPSYNDLQLMKGGYYGPTIRR